MASSCLHPSMRMRDRCKGPASCCRNLRFRQRGSRSFEHHTPCRRGVKGLLAEQVEPVAEELAESHGSDGNRVAQRVVHNDVELGHGALQFHFDGLRRAVGWNYLHIAMPAHG